MRWYTEVLNQRPSSMHAGVFVVISLLSHVFTLYDIPFNFENALCLFFEVSKKLCLKNIKYQLLLFMN